MAKTIIQTIGPLYGEVVNGTVFGRPNGSIFVPPTNVIEIVWNTNRYVIAKPNGCNVCDSEGNLKSGMFYGVAQAQDLASNMQFQIYSDEECTTLVAARNLSAGNFNDWVARLNFTAGSTIEGGTTYYARVQLLNNGSPVATSTIVEVTGVAEE